MTDEAYLFPPDLIDLLIDTIPRCAGRSRMS